MENILKKIYLKKNILKKNNIYTIINIKKYVSSNNLFT